MWPIKHQKMNCAKWGIVFGISPMYPSPIHKIKEIKDDFNHVHFGSAEIIADTLVTLPTHVLLNEKDRKMICEMVGKFIGREESDEPTMRRRAECH